MAGFQLGLFGSAPFDFLSCSRLAMACAKGESKDPRERIEVCKISQSLRLTITRFHFCYILFAKTINQGDTELRCEK